MVESAKCQVYAFSQGNSGRSTGRLVELKSVEMGCHLRIWNVRQETGSGIYTCWFCITDVPDVVSKEMAWAAISHAGFQYFADRPECSNPLEVVCPNPGAVFVHPEIPRISWSDLLERKTGQLAGQIKAVM